MRLENISRDTFESHRITCLRLPHVGADCRSSRKPPKLQRIMFRSSENSLLNAVSSCDDRHPEPKIWCLAIERTVILHPTQSPSLNASLSSGRTMGRNKWSRHLLLVEIENSSAARHGVLLVQQNAEVVHTCTPLEPLHIDFDGVTLVCWRKNCKANTTAFATSPCTYSASESQEAHFNARRKSRHIDIVAMRTQLFCKI